MKKFLKRWFHNEKQQDALDRLTRLEESFALDQIQLNQKLEEANSELLIFREKEKQDQERYTSTIPWVEIKSESYDQVKGIQIALDWNEAFIMYLKENGVEGKTEDGIVQKWLAMLYQDIIGTMEQQSIDVSDIQQPNEFQ